MAVLAQDDGWLQARIARAAKGCKNRETDGFILGPALNLRALNCRHCYNVGPEPCEADLSLVSTTSTCARPRRTFHNLYTNEMTTRARELSHGESLSSTKGAPHELQKFAPQARAAPHWAQNAAVASSTTGAGRGTARLEGR